MGTEEELADLRDAVELMDTKVTPYGERDDGTVATYIVADSTWHRVLAVARGSTSDAARVAIDGFREARAETAREPLNVERLARAMVNIRPYGWNPDAWAMVAARRIVDEYVRLGEPGGEG